MARADGKLFQLLADEVCRSILHALLERRTDLTQRELVDALPYTSSTISRRIGELEDFGLVSRGGARAPYAVVFAKETRELLVAALRLTTIAHRKLADQTLSEELALTNAESPIGSTVVPIRGSGR